MKINTSFDLSNDLGNLLNRTIGMINKYFGGTLNTKNLIQTDFDESLESYTLAKIKEVEDNMDSYHLSNAISDIWSIIARTNKYIDETEPWKLAKEGKNDILTSVMYHLVENLRKVAILIKPFMEDTSCKIMNQLNIKDDNLNTWDSIYEYQNIDSIKVIEKGEPLFVRLEREDEIEYIKQKMKK